MANLVISPLARADMREIGDYISRELRNPDAALRMIRRFKDAMRPLREFPEMGSPLLAAGKQSIPYRYLVCGSYLIFYHVAADAVQIDRVLYGRRDYMALLFGDKLEEDE
ncbi:MAG: type II toxin-antitoxin system RelE/ParE family toxin [Eubacteriales bacterium]|nr:type II toxin-antitoxin system RelE/ParE family toxin [Eubacteriales bacterium]